MEGGPGVSSHDLSLIIIFQGVEDRAIEGQGSALIVSEKIL